MLERQRKLHVNGIAASHALRGHRSEPASRHYPCYDLPLQPRDFDTIESARPYGAVPSALVSSLKDGHATVREGYKSLFPQTAREAAAFPPG